MSGLTALAGSHITLFTTLSVSAEQLGRFLGPALFAAGVYASQMIPRTCNAAFSYRAAYASSGSTYIDPALQRSCTPAATCVLMFPQSYVAAVRYVVVFQLIY